MAAISGPEPGMIDRLALWLGHCLAEPVHAEEIHIDAPSGGGWSNETWIVRTGARSHPSVVVRLEPTRPSMFPTYDIRRQVACLRALAGQSDVPAPDLLAVDIEGTRLGQPAFVMQYVAGRVPSDDSPTFAESGWLAEAGAGEQRLFHTSLLDAIAAVHRVDPKMPELEFLSEDQHGNSNEQAVAALAELWRWDRGDRWPEGIEIALEALRHGVPEPTSDGLLWGDARPANVVVQADGFEPVALLDWELAALGSPERDITWLLEMNWMRIQGAGLDPLPGFLSDDEAVAHYERHTGRHLRHLSWYRYLAAVRVAVLMHRYLRAMVHADRLPADHRLLGDTVASRRLAEIAP